MPDVKRIVICRSAAESMSVGSERGYRCAVCGKEVQVSPTGRLNLDAGGVPVCNPCGFALAHEIRPERIVGLEVNPAAQREMAKRELERKQKSKQYYSECDVCSLAAERYWVWRYRAFGIPDCAGQRVEAAAGKWGICDQCRPMWDARDSKLLAIRAQLMSPSKMPVSALSLFYEVVFSCIESGPTVVEVLAGL